MYRPEGWGNPHIIVIDGVDIDCSVEAKAYEAGADAMLEGLKKDNIVILSMEKGWLIFIPEEA